jgi:subtilisin family serine protease
VAGTLAGKANNGVGIAGVAFNSPLVVCGAFSASGMGLTSDIANCIDWVRSQGAKVISMSFGGNDSTTLRLAVDNAWKNGAADGSVLVAAAGNSGDSSVDYPAGYPDVVSVGATDNRDQRAGFSNTNSDVELAAPGVAILSAKKGGGYAVLSGTSMATPHVSGVAAVLWELHPNATASSIRSMLDGAVDDLGPPGRDDSFGFGRVNLCKAAGGSCAYTGGG